MTRLPAAFLARPIAHRGLHDRKGKVIENSLSAIRAAAAAGYGIEIDLQCSADGEAICFHDDDLQRLTGEPGAVREWRSEDLAEIGLKGGGGDLVPSFAQALEAAGDAPLLVEIKRQGPEIAAGKLEFRAASLIAEHVAAGRGPVAVMSFDPRSVAWFHQHAPEIPRGRRIRPGAPPRHDPDGELRALGGRLLLLPLARPADPAHPRPARGRDSRPVLDHPQPGRGRGRPSPRRQRDLRGLRPRSLSRRILSRRAGPFVAPPGADH